MDPLSETATAQPARTEDLNIRELTPLPSPREVKEAIPLPPELAEVVTTCRRQIQAIITHEDPRPMVIVGPCSAHDPEATIEYAGRLKELQREIGETLLLVMRAYFEKPRTTIGWKGLLYDPHLDESDNIEEGILTSRRILIEIARLGLPAATEILDPIVPQYLCDAISWTAIGARTAESQIHRQMASGLSMPIGFKNSTDGNLAAAIASIQSASSPHAFLGINSEGRAAVATTKGNRYGHLVLRGGNAGPNYSAEHVAAAEQKLAMAGVNNGILVDCSHANSNKDHRLQATVLRDAISQVRGGNRSIIGVMLESFLAEGNQPLASPPSALKYGISITDACIGWEETVALVRELAEARS